MVEAFAFLVRVGFIGFCVQAQARVAIHDDGALAIHGDGAVCGGGDPVWQNVGNGTVRFKPMRKVPKQSMGAQIERCEKKKKKETSCCDFNESVTFTRGHGHRHGRT